MTPFCILKRNHGSTFIGTMVAAALIVCALFGIGTSSAHMKRAMRANELANLAVSIESSLINEFNNKSNYPDAPPVPGGSATMTEMLRKGTLATLTLSPTFGAITIPIQSTSTGSGAQGFLDWNLAPCAVPAFDATNCVLRYEVHLKRTLSCGPPTCPAGQEIYSYAFSYQIDADPDVVPMAPLGSATTFDTAIDPGSYRVGVTLANCDPGNDLFMMGINRDTGEAYCVKKPVLPKCPDGHIPKGLIFSGTGPSIELDCTAAVMRTFNCAPNYSLQFINPNYADPENTSFGSTVPGKCVFTTKHQATTTGTYPPSPTPYMRTVSGTVCPPFYSASSTGTSACHLIPDTTRNNDGASGGKGRCASTAYKNCTRTASNTVWVDNMPAWNAWNADCIAKTAMIPPVACLPEPSTGWASYSCGPTTETSTYCTGTPDISSSCTDKSGWSTGTAYGTGFYDILPTATPVASGAGRLYTCTFNDTSTQCPASVPALDFNGNDWGKRATKWYGGVQVSGVQCVYDPSLNFGKAEIVDAF